MRDDPREIVRLMAKVTRAVQYAHRQGILHRDLKPGNILLDGRGEPLVSDFGLAKWLDTASDLTRTLTIFGTPGYIAPEQAEGPAANLKPSADVYSLGAILFDLLAGRPPFLGEHALAVIRQAADKPAPKLRSLVQHADRDLETICARCLEREPAARYCSAGELAEDLERWLEGRPIVARPVLRPAQLWRWSRRNPVLAGAAAALVALLILIGGLFTWHWQSEALARAEMAKLRQGVLEFAQMEAQVCQPGEKQMQEEVYLRLARQLGIDAKQLQGKLPPFAASLQQAPGATAYERANAAYVAKDYGEAERWAMQAANGGPESHAGQSKGSHRDVGTGGPVSSSRDSILAGNAALSRGGKICRPQPQFGGMGQLTGCDSRSVVCAGKLRRCRATIPQRYRGPFPRPGTGTSRHAGQSASAYLCAE